jgi:RNA polymerase sigma-70 factor (ECF subfamily)
MAKEPTLSLVPPPPAADAQGQLPAPLPAMGDDDLMKLTAAGSRAAFRELVSRYQVRVRAVCLRSAASADEGREIAQEVFVAVWQAAPRYRPGGTFPSFLFTVVRNHLRNSARRRAVADTHLRALARTPAAGSEAPLDQMLAAENERRLRGALEDIPESHRRAIQLRFSAELSYEQIAGICQAPEGTVRSWVHHGLKKLRALLGEP